MTGRFRPTLSLHLLNFAKEGHADGWGHLFALARAAERAGVDRVLVSDHVAFGEALDDYAKPEVGGRVGGRQPTGPDGHWLDPLVTLAMVAAQTSRVRLGTQILQAAIRRPATLAKTVATLDVLSEGRLDLGVGVGWQQAEYDVAGLPFATRGRLLDQSLEVCTALWRDAPASYHADDLSFDTIHQSPKPLQPDGVPIWISGTIRPSTVRRMLRFGLRWIAWGKDEDMAESLPRMRDAIAAAGGAPEGLEASAPLPVSWTETGGIDLAPTMAAVPARLAAGQTDFSFAYLGRGNEDATAEALAGIVAAFDEVSGRADSPAVA